MCTQHPQIMSLFVCKINRFNQSFKIQTVLLQGGMVVVLSVEFGDNALWEEHKQAV